MSRIRRRGFFWENCPILSARRRARNSPQVRIPTRKGKSPSLCFSIISWAMRLKDLSISEAFKTSLDEEGLVIQKNPFPERERAYRDKACASPFLASQDQIKR